MAPAETTDVGTTYATAGERARLRAVSRQNVRVGLSIATPIILVTLGIVLLGVLLGPAMLFWLGVLVAVAFICSGVVAAILVVLAVTR